MRRKSADVPQAIPRAARTTEAVATTLLGLSLTREIGRGAMGLVYEVVMADGRTAALKVLSPRDGIDDEHAARFRREAQLLQRLDHPNIVGLFEYKEDRGFHCFLMEYVDGVSLEDVLKVGPMSLKRTLSVGEQLCDALAHAHAAGVVHRDVKPGNVLMGKDESLRLADFGIGKAPGAGTALGTVTAVGKIYGTPDYMAVEQLNGQQIDGRADLYALGVMLYEILSGARPDRDPKTFAVQLKPLLCARQGGWAAAHAACGNQLTDRALEALCDWQAMRLADVLATANSTFSFTAAMLSRLPPDSAVRPTAGCSRFWRPDPETRAMVVFEPWDAMPLLNAARRT